MSRPSASFSFETFQWFHCAWFQLTTSCSEGSFNRDTFVHGYTMRVVPFEEQHKIDCDNDVMGRTRGWLELEHLEEDERQVRHVLCLSLFLSLSLFVFKP